MSQRRGIGWLLGLGVALLVLTGLDVFRRASRHTPRPQSLRGTTAPRQIPEAVTAISEAEPSPSDDRNLEIAREKTPDGAAAPSSEVAIRFVSLPTRSRSVWVDRALCGPGSPKISDWLRYLQGFRQQESFGIEIHFDFTVESSSIRSIAALVLDARLAVRETTGLKVEPPAIYVHRDLATLRKYSCLPDNAVAFYDGAIHLPDFSKDDALEREVGFSVLHESTHHALIGSGIREPIWFQEGLAMHVAREPWRNFDITPPGFDMRDMVDGFPHTASPKTAERFYGQAYQMVEFLQSLCGMKPDCDTRQLVTALAEGAPVTTFFQDMISARAPRSRVAPLQLWQMYFSGLRPAQ